MAVRHNKTNGVANPLRGPREWNDGGYLSIGIEEELLLLHEEDLSPANRIEQVLERLDGSPSRQASQEIHRSIVEFATGVHGNSDAATNEVLELRRGLDARLRELGLRAAGSGTHPFAEWSQTSVTAGERSEFLHDFLRGLARQEPTFAMHLHLGLPDGEAAVELMDRIRVHLPLLLALSANSPFWRGVDTGLASSRTPLFQTFPRVGLPRPFGSWAGYSHAMKPLLESGAVPDRSFLWWDVRLRPAQGTLEIRIMDSQSTADRTGALASLTQCLAKLELEEGYSSRRSIEAHEVICENRYLAARDGARASLVDADCAERVSVRDRLAELLEACATHASDLDCAASLEHCRQLVEDPSPDRQRRLERSRLGIDGMLARLAEEFTASSAPGVLAVRP